MKNVTEELVTSSTGTTENNPMQIFSNPEFGEVRTIMIGEKPYFVANDVAKALGYSSPKDAITRHCKGATKHRYLTNGGEQEAKIIPEGDVYRLIMKSKLPSAEKFESWVMDEVLPTIRKTGGYVDSTQLLVDTYFGSLEPQQKSVIYSMFATLKETQDKMIKLSKENNELTEINAVQSQQISEMKPKVSYYDVVLQCSDLIPITLIAKDYGMSGQALNKKLHELGIQYKQSKTWILYQKYAEQGYTQTKTTTYEAHGETHTAVHTNWTQKGRLFIYDTLKDDGILPLIERENSNEQ